ncbi:MAG TPA: hypothetical protein PLA51_12545 [Spirochaetota bacterium]|nr:hypothetical protein [Spirochaetota bacterium]
MNAIHFPESMAISGNKPKGDLIHHERSSGKSNSYKNGSDSIEISKAARERFERENLVKLDRVRLKNESLKYMEELKEYFADGDRRKILRLGKVVEIKDNMKANFYNNLPEAEMEKMVEKLLLF